jgi:hypothetical protein
LYTFLYIGDVWRWRVVRDVLACLDDLKILFGNPTGMMVLAGS